MAKLENIAQLAQDAMTCKGYAAALHDEIQGGGNIADCLKLAKSLAEESARLVKVFKALKSATDEREET
jgi:hypothetical protein